MKTTRHYFKWLILGVLGFLLLTACQYDQSKDISSTSQSPVLECRMVTHTQGETCIPINPQRVVTLSLPTLGNVMALGITPIATTNEVFVGSGSQTFVPGKAESIPLVGKSQPNLEAVLNFKPDLIVGLDWNDSVYSALSQIAPTVLGKFDYSAWHEYLSFLAEALGQQDAEEALWQHYNQRIEELNQALGDRYADKTVSFIYIGSGEISIDTRNSFAGGILKDANLQRPASQDIDSTYGAYPISTEEIDKAGGDVLFVTTFSNQGEQTLKEIQQDPLWQTLKAVQENRVYYVDFMSWAAGHILGTDAVIDDLFKYLVNTP